VKRRKTSAKNAGRRSRQRWKNASGLASIRGSSGSRASSESARAWLNAVGARKTTAVQNRTKASSVHTRWRSVLRTCPNTVRHSAGVICACSRLITRSRSTSFLRLAIAPPS